MGISCSKTLFSLYNATTKMDVMTTLFILFYLLIEAAEYTMITNFQLEKYYSFFNGIHLLSYTKQCICFNQLISTPPALSHFQGGKIHGDVVNIEAAAGTVGPL
jgi:hypothetical protein